MSKTTLSPILIKLKPWLTCLPVVLALTACGNKGDLYLLPDELTDLEFDQLQRSLRSEDMPLAEPVEVDDDLVLETDNKPTTDVDERRANTSR